MYDIYLVETLKTYITTPIATGVTDIQVTLNTVTIKNVNRINVKRGQLLELSGKKYTISKISYNDLYKYYTFEVIGNPLSGLQTGVTWKVYNYTATTNSVKLDVDANLSISTQYQITDYSELGSKKDTITQPIVLKGTKANNAAFGNLFYLTKHVDLQLANTLAFNYTPVRSVDCLIYENASLILKGNMICQKVTADEKGSIRYECIVTGKVLELVSLLGDSMLTDLDLKEFEHEYIPDNIKNSWKGYNPLSANSVGNSTYKLKDPITGTITSKAAAYGSGYLYPYIDYGEKFTGTGYDYYNFHKVQNFRPALYLKEYFNKIFSSIDFTYQVKGSPEFIDRFNRLFIPNAEEQNYSEQLGIQGHLTYSGSNVALAVPGLISETGHNPVHYKEGDDPRWVNPFVFNTDVQTNLIRRDNALFPNVQPFAGYSVPSAQRQNQILIINRNFNSTCEVQVTGSFQNQHTTLTTTKVWIQLVKRSRQTGEDTVDDFASWEVLAEKEYSPVATVTTPFNTTLTLDFKPYTKGEQLQVRILRKEANSRFAIIQTSASIKFSKDAQTPFNVETSYGDWIKPIAPSNVKQIDLIVSVAKQMNMLVYNEIENPRNIIFQSYDDFYALTQGTNLKQTAVDWTKKLVKGFTRISNITIPKKYVFTMKSDGDYLNDTYNKTYGEVYGTMKFNDSYGFTAEKKIETIFSPVITAQVGSNRFTPFITKDNVTIEGKAKTKSNIRLMYYSGVHLCDPYTVGDDFWNGSDWTAFFWDYQLKYYPLCSNYAYSANSTIFNNPTAIPKPVADIHFTIPKEFRFTPTDDYYKVITSFDYYANQVKELTNPDMFTIETNMRLNEVDKSTFKLSRPVFLDFGEFGGAYFKVLSIDYKGSGKISKVVLQRIVM